jgi:hypothetical protein
MGYLDFIYLMQNEIFQSNNAILILTENCFLFYHWVSEWVTRTSLNAISEKNNVCTIISLDVYKLYAPRSSNRSPGILLKIKWSGRKEISYIEHMGKHYLERTNPPWNIIQISFMTSRAYLIETIRIENIPKHWPIIEYNHYTILA